MRSAIVSSLFNYVASSDRFLLLFGTRYHDTRSSLAPVLLPRLDVTTLWAKWNEAEDADAEKESGGGRITVVSYKYQLVCYDDYFYFTYWMMLHTML